MDLMDVKPSSYQVEILHPGTAEPTGLVFEIVSLKDPRVKKVVRAKTDARLARRGRLPTQAEMERDEIDVLAAATVGWEWHGDASYAGEKLEHTPENVRKVLGAQWVRQQVDEAASDDQRFFLA